ncbi:MAG: cyclic nucleotide-binding domain-containing protein, partial [Chloroflexi bacterium]|nr:cyclic nucleotide-binding domain-containing protein [Chloroflexota bacterium]
MPGLDLMKLFALRDEFGASAKSGEVIFTPGQAADKFYVVMKGRVQVDRPGFEPQSVAPGELFGEVDVFTNQSRSGQATALDDCNLLAFTAESALKLAEATPSFALVVIRKSCERVANAEARLASGATIPAAAPPVAAAAPPAAAPVAPVRAADTAS